MKDNKTDKLFRKKLSDLDKSPPPMAWDKINAQLHHEKMPLLWWHKAAIVAIFFLSGALIFSLTNRATDVQEVVATTVENKRQIHQDKPDKNDRAQESIATLDNKDIPTETFASKEKGTDSINPINSTNKVAQADKAPTTELPSGKKTVVKIQKEKANQVQGSDPIDLLLAIENLPKVEEVVLVAETKKASCVTIEFKAGRQASDATVIAHTDTPKSSSPIRKLTEKLRELKHTEIDLANLRQAKDDLLAFDSNRNDGKKSEK